MCKYNSFGYKKELKSRDKNIKLSKEIISKSRVIAKGKRIRNLQYLLDKFGGTSSKWVKKSSHQFEINGEFYEYHWYEHHGIGRFDIKSKKVKKR